MINPALFPSWWGFATRYCGLKKTFWGTNVSGATNIEELHQKLTETVMLRRLKQDVLPELPEKIRSVVPIEITNQTEYCQAESDFILWLRKKEGRLAAEKAERAEAITRITYLKTLAARGKIETALSWVQDCIETNNKIIVFAVHHEIIDSVTKKFPEVSVKLTGSENLEQRQKAIDTFQNDPNCKIFVGQLQAAGIGITLTAASHVVFLECGWKPSEHDQAEDRAHRIGQKSCVNIYYLVAENTIEEEIIKLIDQKREILQRILDGTTPETESILTELLNKYKIGEE
jgi:SWI/SNF-related matrix-associated actin-dependent regulator 1 of chromatin subfamily A